MQDRDEDNSQTDAASPSSSEAAHEITASAESPLRMDGSPPPSGLPPTPPRDPLWSGWDVLLLSLVFLGSGLVIFPSIILLVAKFWLFPHLPLVEIAKKPVLALLAEFLSWTTVALSMAALVKGKYGAKFWPSVRWNWPAGAWRFLLFGVGTTFVLSLLERVLPMPKNAPFEQFFAHPLDAYLTSIFAITVGPLMEELLFRGFVYPVLARTTGAGWGILLTALPFGLLHAPQLGYAWGAVFAIVFVGIVLTSVRAVTGSVAASVLVHIGYNGTLMLFTAIQTDGFRHMEKAAVLAF